VVLWDEGRGAGGVGGKGVRPIDGRWPPVGRDKGCGTGGGVRGDVGERGMREPIFQGSG